MRDRLKDDRFIIKTDSWHYRWFASNWESLPSTLCGYAWKMLLVLVIQLPIVIAFSGVILVWCVTFPLWQFVFETGPYDWLASFFFWVLALGGWCAYMNEEYLLFYRAMNAMFPERAELKPPNIVWAYIKAKHRKVCPFVDYE